MSHISTLFFSERDFRVLDFGLYIFFFIKKIILGDISESLSEIFLHILGVYMRSLTLSFGLLIFLTLDLNWEFNFILNLN